MCDDHECPSHQILLFQGMLSARGKQLLFADADGATTFEDISKLQDKLKDLMKGKGTERNDCNKQSHVFHISHV